MEEKFSVSLELMIQKFKDGAKKAQEVSKNVSNKIKENMSVDVGTNAFKGMSTESELLLNKINDIKATLQMASDNPKLLPKQDILEMRVELEKLEGQYNKLNRSSNMFSSSFNKIQDGMNKSLQGAKRFTLSLFGIQSVYRMLSRASSAYLAQDTETSSKIQSAWIGLGSIFAPLLQTVANFVIKAVSYINVFIKALTGTDFLAKAMAKSMNKAGKSAGKLSKILAGFDELTNLDDDAGGASVDTSWTDAFKDVPLDPKIVGWIENIGKVLKPVIDKIKEFWAKLTDEQKLTIALSALSLLALAINPLLGSAIIITVALVGVGVFLSGLKELEQAFKNTKSTLEQTNDATKKWKEKTLEALDAGKLTEEQLQRNIKFAFDWIDANNKTIKSIIDNITIIGSFLGITKEQREQVYKLIDQNEIYVDTLKEIKDRGKLTDEQQQKYVDTLKEQIRMYELVSKGLLETDTKYKENAAKVKDLAQELENLTGKKYKTTFELDGDTSKANKKMNTFWDKLKGIGSSVLSFIGLAPLKIPKFEVGTDYVPNDMLAQIHEGEKIVPKKFNSDEYVRRSDANNNADVVNKIDELIDELRRKDMNAYISESSIGKASQNYRNLQSRIIGEELI